MTSTLFGSEAAKNCNFLPLRSNTLKPGLSSLFVVVMILLAAGEGATHYTNRE